MIAGTMKVFSGFNADNPQHMVWLKRKLARQQRYERQFSRRPSGSGCNQPRHRQSRKPEVLKEPLGRDTITLGWQFNWRYWLVEQFRGDTVPRSIHPQYRRHPITGRIV